MKNHNRETDSPSIKSSEESRPDICICGEGCKTYPRGHNWEGLTPCQVERGYKNNHSPQTNDVGTGGAIFDKSNDLKALSVDSFLSRIEQIKNDNKCAPSLKLEGMKEALDAVENFIIEFDMGNVEDICHSCCLVIRNKITAWKEKLG